MSSRRNSENKARLYKPVSLSRILSESGRSSICLRSAMSVNEPTISPLARIIPQRLPPVKNPFYNCRLCKDAGIPPHNTAQSGSDDPPVFVAGRANRPDEPIR